MNGWHEYKIGNPLRGYFSFKARGGLAEAWKKGCAIFNKGYPCKAGRWITLSIKDNSLIPTTKWIRTQMELPVKERYFSNHSLPTVGFVGVASGISKEKLEIV